MHWYRAVNTRARFALPVFSLAGVNATDVSFHFGLDGVGHRRGVACIKQINSTGGTGRFITTVNGSIHLTLKNRAAVVINRPYGIKQTHTKVSHSSHVLLACIEQMVGKAFGLCGSFHGSAPALVIGREGRRIDGSVFTA